MLTLYLSRTRVNSNVFDSTTYENATLYVPVSAIEKCKEIDPWKNSKTIKANGMSGIDEIIDDLDLTLPMQTA